MARPDNSAAFTNGTLLSIAISVAKLPWFFSKKITIKYIRRTFRDGKTALEPIKFNSQGPKTTIPIDNDIYKM